MTTSIVANPETRAFLYVLRPVQVWYTQGPVTMWYALRPLDSWYTKVQQHLGLPGSSALSCSQGDRDHRHQQLLLKRLLASSGVCVKQSAMWVKCSTQGVHIAACRMLAQCSTWAMPLALYNSFVSLMHIDGWRSCTTCNACCAALKVSTAQYINGICIMHAVNPPM